MHDLGVETMARLLRRAGAQRVSEDAKIALRNILETEALRIGKQAQQLAEHAGRTTVKAKDIDLAFKQ